MKEIELATLLHPFSGWLSQKETRIHECADSRC